VVTIALVNLSRRRKHYQLYSPDTFIPDIFEPLHRLKNFGDLIREHFILLFQVLQRFAAWSRLWFWARVTLLVLVPTSRLTLPRLKGGKARMDFDFPEVTETAPAKYVEENLALLGFVVLEGKAGKGFGCSLRRILELPGHEKNIFKVVTGQEVADPIDQFLWEVIHGESTNR